MTEPTTPTRKGLSRRDLIKASVVAGAAAWTAPVIIDSLASPAAAPSGASKCLLYVYNFKSANPNASECSPNSIQTAVECQTPTLTGASCSPQTRVEALGGVADIAALGELDCVTTGSNTVADFQVNTAGCAFVGTALVPAASCGTTVTLSAASGAAVNFTANKNTNYFAYMLVTCP